jgi:hypothetical protein
MGITGIPTVINDVIVIIITTTIRTTLITTTTITTIHKNNQAHVEGVSRVIWPRRLAWGGGEIYTYLILKIIISKQECGNSI